MYIYTMMDQYIYIYVSSQSRTLSSHKTGGPVMEPAAWFKTENDSCYPTLNSKPKT